MQAPHAAARSGSAQQNCVDVDIMTPIKKEASQSMPADRDSERIRRKLNQCKVPLEWIDIAIGLIRADLVLLAADEVVELCMHLDTLFSKTRKLAKTAKRSWHADMTGAALDDAAMGCIEVCKICERASGFLGSNGLNILYKKAFSNPNMKIPYRLRMVWTYMDWKAATTSTSAHRKKKLVHSLDDLFTPENVCRDEELRCAVNVGMRALEVEKEESDDMAFTEAMHVVDRELEKIELKHAPIVIT
tara:strand:+ start:10472 stop:11209 length:738 start_codon:yes stop_codon:yes gene_type:complete